VTITRAEYMRRTAEPSTPPTLAHRPALVGDVFNQPIVPAPVGGPMLDESLVMVGLRAAALRESEALREAS
jgi:hypothetical protein